MIGMLLTTVCGGIGIIYWPYNLLNDWIFRPKPILKPDFHKRQMILLPKLLNLRREGKHLESDRMQVALMKGFTGYVRRFQYGKKMRIWETCTILAEKEFKKLQDQADYNKRVDLFHYLGRLLFSVIAFTVALMILGNVIINNIAIPLGLQEGDTPHPITKMSKNVKTVDGEVDTTKQLLYELCLSHIYYFISFFYISATFIGNTTVGQRFALFTFYAMPEQETLLNSFLANTALMNVVSCGVKQYATITFSTWCEGSFTYELAILAKNSKLYFHIEGISIFDVILIISVIATLIIIAVNGSGRIRYNDIIEAKSKSKNDP